MAYDDVRRCLACGIPLKGRKRRFCEKGCREMARLYLDRRTGLLRALNAKYATFYFTDRIIIVDILIHGKDQIFSYMLPKTPSIKPVVAFSELSYILGNAWWAEHDRTKKRYVASRFVLEKAKTTDGSTEDVKPVEHVMPVVNGTSLMALNLNRSELMEGDLRDAIKKAYRREVKKHHPDLGGDSVSFRKIHEAYERLIEWSKYPTFRRKTGFPDKWFYDGGLNRWIEPTRR